MSESKACTKCGAVKSVGEFRKDPRSRSGLGSWCRSCSNEACRAWHANNPERRRAHIAKWRAANGEQMRAYDAARHAANPAPKRAAAAAWKAANPDKSRDIKARRRARKAAAPVVERIYRSKVWARDGGRCHICHKPCDPNDWHLEHIVPLAAGGEHSYRNVAVSHPACNQRKGVRGPGQLRLVA